MLGWKMTLALGHHNRLAFPLPLSTHLGFFLSILFDFFYFFPSPLLPDVFGYEDHFHLSGARGNLDPTDWSTTGKLGANLGGLPATIAAAYGW